MPLDRNGECLCEFCVQWRRRKAEMQAGVVRPDLPFPEPTVQRFSAYASSYTGRARVFDPPIRNRLPRDDDPWYYEDDPEKTLMTDTTMLLQQQKGVDE